jgi:hypothetical protein
MALKFRRRAIPISPLNLDADESALFLDFEIRMNVHGEALIRQGAASVSQAERAQHSGRTIGRAVESRLELR